jgi:hypothetical protein
MAQGFETGEVANGQGVLKQYLAVHLQLFPGQMIASDYPFLFRFSGLTDLAPQFTPLADNRSTLQL